MDKRRIALLVHSEEVRHLGVQAERGVHFLQLGWNEVPPDVEVEGITDGWRDVQAIEAAAEYNDEKTLLVGFGFGGTRCEGPGKEAR